MKRIQFSIRGSDEQCLREPGFVEECSELPVAIMRAVEDFLEVHGTERALPMVIEVRASDAGPSC